MTKETATTNGNIEIYCRKCKSGVEVLPEYVPTSRGGMRAAAVCPVCGGKLSKFVPKNNGAVTSVADKGAAVMSVPAANIFGSNGYQKQKVRCFVYQSGIWEVLDLPASEIPPRCIVRGMDRKWNYVLVEKSGDTFIPFNAESLPHDANILPSDLYGLTYSQWKKRLFWQQIKYSTLQRIKVALMFGLLGIIGIGIFLIGATVLET